MTTTVLPCDLDLDRYPRVSPNPVKLPDLNTADTVCAVDGGYLRYIDGVAVHVPVYACCLDTPATQVCDQPHPPATCGGHPEVEQCGHIGCRSDASLQAKCERGRDLCCGECCQPFHGYDY